MRERESDPKIVWEISISVANMTPLLQRKGLRVEFSCKDFSSSLLAENVIPSYFSSLLSPLGGASMNTKKKKKMVESPIDYIVHEIFALFHCSSS